MCDFLEEIARHKTFSAHFLEEIACHKLFRLISLRKSLATNFFGSFPQEIGRHETFSAHFLRKSAAHLLTHFLRKSATTYSLIPSGNRPSLTHSFPQEIVEMHMERHLFDAVALAQSY